MRAAKEVSETTTRVIGPCFPKYTFLIYGTCRESSGDFGNPRHISGPELSHLMMEMVLMFCNYLALCSFPRDAIINYHKLGDLKEKTVMFSSLWKSKYQQGHAGSETLERILPCLSWLLVVASSPWNSLTYSCIFPMSASLLTQPSSSCVFEPPLSSKGHQSLDLEPTLIHHDLNFITSANILFSTMVTGTGTRG